MCKGIQWFTGMEVKGKAPRSFPGEHVLATALPGTVLLLQVVQCVFAALDHHLIKGHIFFICQLFQIFDQLIGHTDGFIGGLPLDDLKHSIILSLLGKQAYGILLPVSIVG